MLQYNIDSSLELVVVDEDWRVVCDCCLQIWGRTEDPVQVVCESTNSHLSHVSVRVTREHTPNCHSPSFGCCSCIISLPEPRKRRKSHLRCEESRSRGWRVFCTTNR